MKILLTGATGMVGGIIQELALKDERVTQVVSLVRKPSGTAHPKLRELIHKDFADFQSVRTEFKEAHAGYFCIGVYTGAVPDAQFKVITYDYAAAFSDMLKAESPNANMCLLSGAGADQKEKSRISFAKYKGMAENHMIRNAHATTMLFRPGYIYPVKKRKEPNFSYTVFRALYPILGPLMGRNNSIKSTELAEAILDAGLKGNTKVVWENRDIRDYFDAL